jgi:hypothetical protein
VTVLFECFSIGFIGMAIIVDSINNDDRCVCVNLMSQIRLMLTGFDAIY